MITIRNAVLTSVVVGFLFSTIAIARLLAPAKIELPPTDIEIAEEKDGWEKVVNGLQCRLLPVEQEVEPSTGDFRDKLAYVTYELRNLSDKEIKFLPVYCPLEGVYSGSLFRVIDKNGRTLDYKGKNAERMPPTASSYLTIKSGQTLSKRVGLPYDFSTPGPHRVTTKTAVLQNSLRFYYGNDSANIAPNPDNVWSGELKSNEVTVNVVPSKGIWGNPTKQGLAIRLRDIQEAPVGVLQADLGNKGYIPWKALKSRKLFELEVDGRKYVNAGEIVPPDTQLKPGQIMSDITIPLDTAWLSEQKPFTPLKFGELTPGTHSIRIGFIAEPVDRTHAKPTPLMSNPVEFKGPFDPDNAPMFTQPVNVEQTGVAWDGGTVFLHLVDAAGKKLEACFDYGMNSRTPGKLFIGGTHPTRGAKAATQMEEKDLITALRAWLDAQYSPAQQKALFFRPNSKGWSEAEMHALRLIGALKRRGDLSFTMTPSSEVPHFALYKVLGHKNAPSIGNDENSPRREIMFSGTGNERDGFDCRRPENYPLSGLILEEQPLLTGDDILAYDWRKHIITLKPGVYQRIGERGGFWLTPFVVKADDRLVYLGAFQYFATSSLAKMPTITLMDSSGLPKSDPHYLPKHAIRIENSQIGQAGELPVDLREDEGLYKVLQKTSKLLDLRPGEPPWGDAVEGVRSCLTKIDRIAGRSDWPHPVLRLGYSTWNAGQHILHLPQNGRDHQVEVDGQWYEWVDPPREVEGPGQVYVSKRGGKSLDFGPTAKLSREIDLAGNWLAIPKGKEQEYAARRYGGGGWLVDNEDHAEELLLTPGKHKIRVAVICPSARAPFNEVIRAVSNVQEVDHEDYRRGPGPVVDTSIRGKSKPSTTPLRYEIVLREAKIESGAALGLEAHIHNDGKEAVTIPWDHTVFEDIFRFSIIGPDGKPVAVPGDRFSVTRPSSLSYFKELPAGGTLKYRIFLGSMGRNCQQWFFRKPGQYQLSAQYVTTIDAYIDPETGRTRKDRNFWTGTLDAKPMQFTVTSAAKPGDVVITGNVVDQQGKAVAGAKVMLHVLRTNAGRFGIDGQFLPVKYDRCYSDADGAFTFKALPNDLPMFSVKVNHPQHPPAQATITHTAKQKFPQTSITMSDGVEVRGRVIDDEGRPLPGVSVRSYAAERNTSTDRDGRFRIGGIPPTRLDFDFWKKNYAMVTAKVANDKAGSGDWTITLTHHSKLTFTGRLLEDKRTPLANKRLEFLLKGADGGSYSVRCKTDDQGRYKVALNKDGVYDGHLWVEDKTWNIVVNKQFHPELTRRWRTPVSGVQPGKNIDLFVRHDGEIKVNVTPGKPLPKQTKLAVLLHMECTPDDRWQQADARVLSSVGGEVTFGQLSPGQYKVRVSFTDHPGISWERKITLGDQDASLKATMNFALPKMGFGGVKAQVVDEQGNPVGAGRGWFNSSGLNGELKITQGVLQVNDLIAGPLSLQCRQGNNSVELNTLVHDGKVTDLGTLVVKRQPQRDVKVSGRIQFEDGTPAMGARVETGGLVNGGQVKPDGSFEAMLYAGHPLRIHLRNAPGWWGPKTKSPHPDYLYSPPPPFSMYTDEFIGVPLDTKSGQVSEQQIVIDRKGRRAISVEFRGTLPVEPQFAARMNTGERYSVRSGFGRFSGNTMTISQCPDGEGMFVLTARDYIGYAPVKSGDCRIAFDRTDCGSIVGQVKRSDGVAAQRVRVILTPAAVDDKLLPWHLMDGSGAMNSCIGQTTDRDGRFHFNAVAPGHYIVVTRSFKEPDARVTVNRGEQKTVEIVSDNNPENPPPLAAEAAGATAAVTSSVSK